MPAEKDPALIVAFKKRRSKQFLVTIAMVAAVIPFVLIEDSEAQTLLGLPVEIFIILSFVLIIGGVIFSLVNWRCPGCKKYLGKRINPKFCSSCGAALQ